MSHFCICPFIFLHGEKSKMQFMNFQPSFIAYLPGFLWFFLLTVASCQYIMCITIR